MADGKTFKVTKGAPQVILGLSANAATVKPEMDRAVDGFAQRGFRSLGVARADEDGTMAPTRRPAAVRPAARGRQATIATAGQMGVRSRCDGRCARDRPRDSQNLGMAMTYWTAERSRLQDGGERGGSQVRREADGFASLSRAQVSYRRCVAEARPHRRHDGDGVNDAPR